MIELPSRNTTRKRVHKRIRTKLMGTPQRPRLNVYRSLNHIYVQIVDDMQGQTLVATSSLAAAGEGKAKGKGARKTGGNVASAKDLGKRLAELARAKGITRVVFDRGGYLYHGRVKALADAAREAGLEF
ncbi:MAG: 50S ribosomal protein L18 [Terriglobales bacterium]